MPGQRRITILGSFSTGKTTLVQPAAARLGLPVLHDVAREISALGFKLDKDATVETEALIFLKQYANELAHPEFVGEYSLFLVLAYAGWVLEHQERRKEFALWDACLEIAGHGVTNYSHVFYLPIEFPIVPDGLRPEDPAFQADIDRRIVELLKFHEVPYVELRGSVPERLDALSEAVD
jgi:nicotinamide riboside kinase